MDERDREELFISTLDLALERDGRIVKTRYDESSTINFLGLDLRDKAVRGRVTDKALSKNIIIGFGDNYYIACYDI